LQVRDKVLFCLHNLFEDVRSLLVVLCNVALQLQPGTLALGKVHSHKCLENNNCLERLLVVLLLTGAKNENLVHFK